jgi:glycerophosphoryl diester phosphodiesterase
VECVLGTGRAFKINGEAHMHRTLYFALILVLAVVSPICALIQGLIPGVAISPQTEPPTLEHDQAVLVIGHRGAAGLAPENTLGAIQVALDLGVDGVEFDVQRSADNELILMHDLDVDRTTNGRGLVNDLTLAELQALDAGSSFSDAFAGEPVPSLRNVFDLVSDSQILLFIELKDPSLYPGIEQQVVDLIREYNYESRVHILSFDYDSLDRVRELAPELILSGLWSRNLPADTGGYDVVNARYTLFRGMPRAIDRYHDQGALVMAWTVDEIPDMEWLIEQGIDGITTNRPDQLLSLLR